MVPLLFYLLHSAYSRNCEGKDKSYNIGDKIYLCFYLEDANYTGTNDISVQDFQNILAVEVKVDVFSGVRLKNAYKDLMRSKCLEDSRLLQSNTTENNSTGSGNSTESSESSESSESQNPDDSNSTDYDNCSVYSGIAVAFNKKKFSVFSPYIKKKYVGGAYSLVVTLKKGKVSKLEWDNDCGLCDEKCIEWEKEEICAEKLCKGGSESDCDPRVYVTWIGTDGNDENLVSASYRISQFRKYSVFSMYSEARNKF